MEFSRPAAFDSIIPSFIETHGEGRVRYQIFGKPDRAFIEGVHGSEFRAIYIITNLLEKRILENNLGTSSGLIHIGNASESAVKQLTMRNKYDNNLNREFYRGSQDPEAKAWKYFLQHTREVYGKFKRILITHMDLYQSHFYMYDLGNNRDDLDHYALLSDIQNEGVNLLTGRDIPVTNTDPALGYYFEGGYAHIPLHSHRAKKDFSLESYAIRNGFADRIIVAEIPGKIFLTRQEKIGEILVRHMMES